MTEIILNKIALISPLHTQEDLIATVRKTLDVSEDFSEFELVGIPLIPLSIEHENVTVLLHNLCMATWGAVDKSEGAALAVALSNEQLADLSEKGQVRQVYTVGSIVVSDVNGPMHISAQASWVPKTKWGLFETAAKVLKKSFRQGYPETSKSTIELCALVRAAITANVELKVETYVGTVH